jgi:hypothetical protein
MTSLMQVPVPTPTPAGPPQPAQAYEYLGVGILDDQKVRVYRSFGSGLMHVGPLDRHGPDRPAPEHLSFAPPATGPVVQAGKAPYVTTSRRDSVTVLPTGVNPKNGHPIPSLNCRLCGS